MKALMFICILMVILFTACSKSTCEQEFAGDYSGTIKCSENIQPSTVSLSQPGHPDEIQISIGIGNSTIVGNIEADCTTIGIESQNITYIGIDNTVEGELYWGQFVLLGALDLSGEGRCLIDMVRS